MGHAVVVADQQENIEGLNFHICLYCLKHLGFDYGGKRVLAGLKEMGNLKKASLPKMNRIPLNPSLLQTLLAKRNLILIAAGPEDIVIPSGRNTYQFELSLPSGIPSTFEGEHGNVAYHIEGFIKRSGSPDVETTCPLTVSGILDLNNNHDAQVDRPEVASEKHLCCLCCKSGPIGFHFRVLGKSGWIAGDNIPFSAEAYNMSAIMLITTYSAKEKSKTVTKELLKMKGPSISRGGTGLWNNANIELPNDLPPTKLAGRGQIINVAYHFDVVLEIPRGSNLSAQIPIIIGTVPLGLTVDEVVKEGLN
ncbi:Arrestin domain-containing protein 3 [Orchesella cincta]|uniref:Arrestin domain-containing protein 3 n=1 Tax=Orchesella cincta TaxID=48709 RepID=A0A1D2MQV8_ORCCI|nr:Arrestin domain-containing protein 3 [Orchesella cincta]